MTARPDPTSPVRRAKRPRTLSLAAGLLAAGFVVLSFPIDAAGTRGGGSAGSRGGSGGGSSSSGGGRSFSGGSRSSSAPSRGSSGSRSYSAPSRSSSGGSRSYSAPSRSSSGGSRSYSAPSRSSSGGARSDSSGWRAWSSSTTASGPVRTTSGDRAYGSPAPSAGTSGGAAWGPRSATAAGTRGSGGPPPSGGNPGGGNPGHPGGGHPGGGGGGGGHDGGGHGGGGHHHGGGHGWYCPPVYWGGSSWYWGGPWDWWWGWGPYWGYGWGWGWGGGVYVIREGEPLPDRYARIDTDVSPETAEVYLDGTYIGSADDFDGFPDYLYLEAGKYRLEFRHPFYETLVKELDVRPSRSFQFDDEMALLAGKKRLEVVDPEQRGTPLGRVFGRPETKAEGEVRDRTGRFEVEGSLDADETEEIPAADVDALPPTSAKPAVATTAPPEDVAPADRGRLRFEVEPEDAVVYVDDRYSGTGEELAGLRRGLAVKPGLHTITVARPGYRSKTIEVEAKPGTAIDVVVELEK